jgi:methylglutaconyl-CoA hydratase
VRRELDRVPGGLGAAVHCDQDPPVGGLDEELRGAHPLLDRQQEALPRRAERKQAVDSPRDEEVDVGGERGLVERLARIPQRRQRRGQCAFEHRTNFKLDAVDGLRTERDGHVLRVTLARPERRNAFDAELIADLTEAFNDVADARAVVLAGEGPSFCAGADIDWQRSAIDLTFDENVEDALRLYRMCETIDRCPAPVVARVHGFALGGGSGLVACSDVAVAAPDATFGFSEVKLGIIPAVISPFVLPKLGAHARRYFLTGERFDAETALRIGLVEEVAADLDGAVDRLVDDLLTSGPEAVREAKKLIRERPHGEETARIAARLRAGDEGQEGLRAFLERRAPSWRD